MKDIVMVTMTEDEFQALIIRSVNACLRHNPTLKKVESFIEEQETGGSPKRDPSKRYTSNEAREILQISRYTEGKLNNEGKLKFSMVGGRKRYTWEQIEKAMIPNDEI